MFGMEETEDQDPKSQVLQEILDFAREKMMAGAKGKESPEGEMSVEISTESPEGMDAVSEEKPKDGLSGEKLCPHCGKSC